VIAPAPTDVRELIAQLTELMAPLAADKALAFAATVAPALPASLLVDPVRVRQILLNLIANAVKYTGQGWVRLEVAFERGELVLAVADSGPGIDPAHQRRIFAPYHRAGRTAGAPAEGTASDPGDPGGSGLGLHITRDLVERMGGQIEVDSALGRGSRFLVRLPAMTAADRDTDGGHETDVVPGRLLIGEDDLDLRILFGVFLERAGFVPVYATTAAEVVEAVRETAPQLVLLDLNLAGPDGAGAGFACARRVRQAGYDGPMIAMSAAEGVIADEALDAGFDAFVGKPLRPEALLGRVFDLLRRRAAPAPGQR
jgi:CheY-like chemotaxis protein/anti-sigma regulatory factor (Ser/Thr protein kinase)